MAYGSNRFISKNTGQIERTWIRSKCRVSNGRKSLRQMSERGAIRELGSVERAIFPTIIRTIGKYERNINNDSSVSVYYGRCLSKRRTFAVSYGGN